MADANASPPRWRASVSKEVWDTWRDVQINVTYLMKYLTESVNGRLQAQFDDTRNALTIPDSDRKSAVPPCKTYARFLKRLAAIETALSGDDAPEPEIPAADPAVDPIPADAESLPNIPFLYWSQDFLSSIAAPVTADSAMITEQYVRARAGSILVRYLPDRLRKLVLREKDGDSETGIVDNRKVAQWMASLMHNRELLAFWLILLVILLSTYSISGQIILKSREDNRAQLKAINERITSTQWDVYPSSGLSVAQPAPGTNAAPNANAPASPTLSIGTGLSNDGLIESPCDLIYPVHANPSQPYPSLTQLGLCQERQQMLRESIAIATQELSWLHVLKWFDQFNWTIGVFGHELLHLNLSVLRFFGDGDKNVNREFRCYKYVDHIMSERAGDADPTCGDTIEDNLEYYGKVPQALLQCLSLYLLPSLYGALGAILATMRYIRGRVAMSLLDYTDRGRIQQDWVLGLVLGALIGLFADYFSKANVVQGVSLAALALLAGYNVAAVFGLFEDLSKRIFATSNPSDGASKDAVAK